MRSYSLLINPTDYSQCVPGKSSPKPTTTPTYTPNHTPTPTPTPKTTLDTNTNTTPTTSSSCSTPKSGAGKVKYAGINIAGFDFGVSRSLRH